MTDDPFSRTAAYRRTLEFLNAWRCPEGVTISLVCWPQQACVDVILSSQGIEKVARNLLFCTQKEADEVLGLFARFLMALVVAAYRAHEPPGARETMLGATLFDAGRTFEDCLELIVRRRQDEARSAACRGKGGGG